MYTVYYEFENNKSDTFKMGTIEEFPSISEKLRLDAIGAGTEIKELRIKKEK